MCVTRVVARRAGLAAVSLGAPARTQAPVSGVNQSVGQKGQNCPVSAPSLLSICSRDFSLRALLLILPFLPFCPSYPRKIDSWKKGKTVSEGKLPTGGTSTSYGLIRGAGPAARRWPNGQGSAHLGVAPPMIGPAGSSPGHDSGRGDDRARCRHGRGRTESAAIMQLEPVARNEKLRRMRINRGVKVLVASFVGLCAFLDAGMADELPTDVSAVKAPVRRRQRRKASASEAPPGRRREPGCPAGAWGWTPLIYAMRNNHAEIATLLLDKGAHVNSNTN